METTSGSRAARAGQHHDSLPEPERAREIALGILTRAQRSAADLRGRLVAKGISEHVADEVIARYREVGLLDDTALAASIARTRHAEKGVAARAIEPELRRKGFSDEDIRSALAQIGVDDEREAASELARARWRRTEGLSRDTRVRRVVSHLGRKGYSPSLAFALVKDLESADTHEEY